MTFAISQLPALTLVDYFSRANETDRFSQVPLGLEKLRFGFFGEIGGLLAAVKKVSRDQLKESETEVAGEEIGDALWYLIATAHMRTVSPDELGRSSLRALRKRFSEVDHVSDGATSFRQIDGIVAVHGQGLAQERIAHLSELAQASGELLGRKDMDQRQLAEQSLSDIFGHLLALLAITSAAFSLKLEDVARDNLEKIRSRWPGNDPAYCDLFDDGFPEHEQLPRLLPIEFIERGGPIHGHVVQRLHGVFIGDRLTDNSNEPDDYRFHDVFHLAYIAHLGWSPVIRALLKVKRKSIKSTDDNEDGARAMIIEEGIATWIFNHAKRRDFYEDISIGKLDYGLLKQVHSMVSGYEVDRCPLWQWEKAILDGFRIFREIRRPANRGGTVIVDIRNHSIEFNPSTQAEA